jgi:hypothetical protein
MKTRISLGLLLLASAIALSGCGKANNVTAPTDSGSNAVDQSLATEAVMASPEMTNEDVFTTEEETVFGASGTAAVNPLRFWRTIRNVSTRIDFVFSDPDSNGRPTRAVATVHRNLAGTFNLLVGDPADTSRKVIRKPLEDHWVRRLAMVRTRVWDDSAHTRHRERWHVVGTSGVEITSKDATSQVQSLRVQAGALDTTITNPLEMFRLRHVLKIDIATPVTLTATTGRTDDVVLMYRFGYRQRFTNNGDGTYTYQWTTADFGGLRHLGVNALSNGTVYDDVAAYDSKAWILPFVVRPMDDPVAAHYR